MVPHMLLIRTVTEIRKTMPGYDVFVFERYVQPALVDRGTVSPYSEFLRITT